MKKVGIVGFGSFGKFLAEQLDTHCHVLAYDKHTKAGKWNADIADVATTDFVVLAVPLDAYEDVLQTIKPSLRPETVVVDICSVKEEPSQLLRAALPNQPIAITHPLFGPESAKESVEGHTLVLCPDVSDAKALQAIETFAQSLGLHIVKMKPEEHDAEMATVQGLTFFIARTLQQFGLDNQKLSTPSFKRLLYLKELETHHSPELFYTIQTGNQKTAEAREKFIKLAEDLHHDIQKHHK